MITSTVQPHDEQSFNIIFGEAGRDLHDSDTHHPCHNLHFIPLPRGVPSQSSERRVVQALLWNSRNTDQRVLSRDSVRQVGLFLDSDTPSLAISFIFFCCRAARPHIAISGTTCCVRLSCGIEEISSGQRVLSGVPARIKEVFRQGVPSSVASTPSVAGASKRIVPLCSCPGVLENAVCHVFRRKNSMAFSS